jgi:hypothetical protein
MCMFFINTSFNYSFTAKLNMMGKKGKKVIIHLMIISCPAVFTVKRWLGWCAKQTTRSRKSSHRVTDFSVSRLMLIAHTEKLIVRRFDPCSEIHQINPPLALKADKNELPRQARCRRGFWLDLYITMDSGVELRKC